MEGELPRDLGKLSNLQQLHLRQGAAGIGSSSSSAPHLKHLENVEYLDLTIGAAVEKFPFPRFPFPQLRVLEISYGNQIQQLPSDLGIDLPQLRQLRLHVTEGLTELPDTITRLQHLTSLDIEHAPQLASLPEGIGALSRLRYLRLSRCAALQHLPASLTRLTCLHELNVEGTGIRALPANVAQLSRVKELYLGGCKQLQALPEGLTDLTMLRLMEVKGSDLAIDSMSDEQECRIHNMYDLRTDISGQ
ncbi:unnamed protein product [Closterium sp. Naga37s-1]|nr:unnamed protein product [Closterium sp. Naga37s-1]